MFVELPPRDLEDYYSFIERPISLSCVQKRLKRKRYQGNVEKFKNDVMLIFDNATSYNTSKSQIYRDAEFFKASYYCYCFIEINAVVMVVMAVVVISIVV